MTREATCPGSRHPGVPTNDPRRVFCATCGRYFNRVKVGCHAGKLPVHGHVKRPAPRPGSAGQVSSFLEEV